MNKHKNVYKEIEKTKRKITRLAIFPFQMRKKAQKGEEKEKKEGNYWKIYENGKKMKIRQYFVSNGVCVAADGNS